MSKRPLEGVRVLDLSRHLAGPTCTQFLADFGAEVIKIERPEIGDDNRRLGPPFLKNAAGEEVGDSPTFLATARSKKSVTVDIGNPEGAQLIRDLAKTCDVVVENFRPGTLAKYGLDYAGIKAVAPDIIYCSVTGFGQTGPNAPRSGVDSLFQAMSGLMGVTGEPDGPPQKVGFFVGDVLGGIHAVVGILAALYARDKNGQPGQHIDISLVEAMMGAMGHHFQMYLNTGVDPKPAGVGSPDGSVPVHPFRCKDAPLQVSAASDASYNRLVAAMGHPELSEVPEYATRVARIQNKAALLHDMEQIFLTKTRQEWIDILAPANVVCAPIYTIGQALNDPHIQARGMTVEVDHPVGGKLSLLANPIRFSESEMTYTAPPLIGQHTDEVLGDVLGLAPDRLKALHDAKVV